MKTDNLEFMLGKGRGKDKKKRKKRRKGSSLANKADSVLAKASRLKNKAEVALNQAKAEAKYSAKKTKDDFNRGAAKGVIKESLNRERKKIGKFITKAGKKKEKEMNYSSPFIGEMEFMHSEEHDSIDFIRSPLSAAHKKAISDALKGVKKKAGRTIKRAGIKVRKGLRNANRQIGNTKVKAFRGLAKASPGTANKLSSAMASKGGLRGAANRSIKRRATNATETVRAAGIAGEAKIRQEARNLKQKASSKVSSTRKKVGDAVENKGKNQSFKGSMQKADALSKAKQGGANLDKMPSRVKKAKRNIKSGEKKRKLGQKIRGNN